LFRAIPFIAQEESFALKGGTAINLFVELGASDWELLAVPKADRLPAVKWRQQKLAKLARNKRIALTT
jgi:hypothetical protein